MHKINAAAVLCLGLAMPFTLATAGVAAQMASEKTVMVGGAPMYPSKNIVQNAVNSKDHTTLVAAVKGGRSRGHAGRPRPVHGVRPTNEAFARLPSGTVDNLLKPENKAMLKKVLTYHVVSGDYSAAELKKMVREHGGKAMLKTVEGDPLTLTTKGSMLYVAGEKGGNAEVTIPDVKQSNGVIQVVNTVLMPD